MFGGRSGRGFKEKRSFANLHLLQIQISRQIEQEARLNRSGMGDFSRSKPFSLPLTGVLLRAWLPVFDVKVMDEPVYTDRHSPACWRTHRACIIKTQRIRRELTSQTAWRGLQDMISARWILCRNLKYIFLLFLKRKICFFVLLFFPVQFLQRHP